MPSALGLFVLLALCVLAPRLARAQTLDAPDDVRETSHRVVVSLAAGVAAVEEHFTLARTGAGRAEIELYVPLPEHATVVSIRVCRGRRCRRLRDAGDRSTGIGYAFSLYLPPRGGGRGGPIATATRDGAGVVLRLAPIDRSPLGVDLRYAVPLAIHEGRARLVIPMADADPRLAPTEVDVTSVDLAEASVAGLGSHAILDPPSEVLIEARVAASTASVHRRASSTRVFAATPRVVSAHDVILAVDVSPSMEDVPSGRLDAALRATLAALPLGSRVRVLRFGARAEWASPDAEMPAWAEPAEIVPSAILDVAFGALGSRTLYAPIAARVGEALVDARSPLLIVLGDGWLDGPDFASVASAGVRVVVVDVGDAPFATSVDAAARAWPSTLALRVGASLDGGEGTPISAAVAEPAAPVSLRDGSGDPVEIAATPSGEAFAVEIMGRASMSALGGPTRASSAPWSVLPRELATSSIAVDPRVWGDVAKLEAGGPAPRRVPGGLGSVDDAITGAAYLPGVAIERHVPRIRVVQAEIRAMASPRGMRNVIVRALRSRARGCFAQARHGRPSWSARAYVHLLVAHREVVAGSVGGVNVDAALAACIERGFEQIQVPPSYGYIVIDYPFVTMPVAPTAAAPLHPDVRATLEAIIGPLDAAALDAEARAMVSP